MTAAVGMMFLVTAARGHRPLTLAAQQSWTPSRAQQLAENYRADPQVRRGHRVSSTVWGAALLTEAAVRVPLVYLLPISVMVGLSTALMIVTFGGLITWNAWYVARLRGPEQGGLEQGSRQPLSSRTATSTLPEMPPARADQVVIPR